jgi:hypothetical protein
MSAFPPPHGASSHDKRDVKKVPFVELVDGRLQGVVSSGSDIQRVYVSFFEVGTLNFSCSTNNNRPCGGANASPCGHLRELLEEAIAQYGFEAVVKFLRLPGDTAQITTAHDILIQRGRRAPDQAGSTIFTRFLSDLQALEAPASDAPLHEMSWFVG